MRILLVLSLVLIAGCVGTSSVIGYTDLGGLQGQGSFAALATHVMHYATPHVEDNTVVIDIEFGSLKTRNVTTNDPEQPWYIELLAEIGPLRRYSLTDVQYTLDVPQGWEVVSGEPSLSFDLAEGEMYADTIVIRPQRPGVWEMKSTMAIKRDQIDVPGLGDRYPDSRTFYVLYDGSQILLSSDGVWCAEGTYFDAERLVCTTAPECPEGYVYINGTAECGALATQIEDDQREETPYTGPPGDGPGPG